MRSVKKKSFITDSGDNPLIISLSAFTNMSLSSLAKCQKESQVESSCQKSLCRHVFWGGTYCGGRSGTKIYTVYYTGGPSRNDSSTARCSRRPPQAGWSTSSNSQIGFTIERKQYVWEYPCNLDVFPLDQLDFIGICEMLLDFAGFSNGFDITIENQP